MAGVKIQQDMYESGKALPEDMRGAFYAALLDYAFEGKEPEEPVLRALVKVCADRLDMSRKRSEEGAKSASKRWGNSTKKTSGKSTHNGSEHVPIDTHNGYGTAPINTHNGSTHVPIDTHNAEYEYEYENELKKEKVKRKKAQPSAETQKPKKQQQRFVKPSVKEVDEYIKLKGYDIDAEKFWNYYESKGWLIGKTPMKNWKAAVGTWSKQPTWASSGANSKPQKLAKEEAHAVFEAYEPKQVQVLR